ncbi:hypothetical protein BDV23DRAFT_194833 [Aspergillus alliaceus]|uniref:FAD-binding PCMH-type domain-containing protein n=1 Tax=Petromyces alliaceus TaxID=209559 RepID=A0A5N7CLQ8_PETAA|nr:hypothetical protein BDV23DRAFT_194833 [Aspergillus alliaceus]
MAATLSSASLLYATLALLTPQQAAPSYSALLSLSENISCKVTPDDAAWPSTSTCTVSLAAYCYSSWPEYDSTKCKVVSDNWTVSYIHVADPTSIMWPLYEGRTCLHCRTAVNVSSVAQIQLAVNFSRNTGIRLVVKNTGYIFNGKSTDIQYYEDYQVHGYRGPAVKMGVGVQASEIYAMAKELGFTAVGCESKSVSVAGGFVLGGGPSPMSSIYGLAADQVLALEVVLGNGRFVTVTAETNLDLFWALRGGGGNTYGIVTSIISRIHPKVGVTTSTFNFAISGNVTEDTFWAGVRAYVDRFAVNADAGTYAHFWDKLFNALMHPWFDELDHLGIPYTPDTKYRGNSYDAWDVVFPLEAVASTAMVAGSRLFLRANWEDASLLNKTFDALKITVTAGYTLTAFSSKAELADGYPESFANPAFRKTHLHAITSTSWTANYMNTQIHDRMEHFASAGAYMLEANTLEPNFQLSFHGSNYERLYKIKQKYGPSGLPYAPPELVVRTGR